MAGKTIWVGGFGDDVDETKLHEVFSTFGTIMDIQIPLDPNKRHDELAMHRGFGFIEFQQPTEALDAIDNMDKNELNGKQLKCYLARPKPGASTLNTQQPIWTNAEYLETLTGKEDKTVA